MLYRVSSVNIQFDLSIHCACIDNDAQKKEQSDRQIAYIWKQMSDDEIR